MTNGIDTWSWRGVQFENAGKIVVRCDVAGKVAINRTSAGNDKYPGRPLNPYATLPFCWFSISMPHSGPGVYVYFLSGTPVYVGKTKRTMYARFTEYRSINARKCLRDGQPQSCRINNLVLQSYIGGQTIDVRYAITPEYDALESEIIAALRPAWNIAGLA